MNTSINDLIAVVKQLRHPEDGCPWDLKQTHQTLLKYLIEESYEYIQAVDNHDIAKMKDELGDVLFQVILHSELASEKNHFTIDEVARTIKEKMIRRHPHVFKDKSIAKNEQEVIANWKRIKGKEKQDSHFFTEQDAYAPALKASYDIGVKSKKINFDWDNVQEVWEKVKEEFEETAEEFKIQDQVKLEEELGDLLFSIAQFARHSNIDPEQALFKANKKFIKRINKVEDLLNGQSFTDVSREKLEELWIKSK